MPPQMRRGEPNRKANIWTARFIPLLLVGIIGYTTWVVVDLVAIRYLINPSPSLLLNRRGGAAIAILVIFFLLLLILLACYARLVQTIIANPGTVPRGPQYYVEQARKAKEGRAAKQGRYASEKEATSDIDSSEGYGKISKRRKASDEEALKIQDFWHKDVFVCKYDGRPPFCSQCFNYKPTRSHHCSELNQCVYKMDHFCPWVAGIVSENSFNYFIIFTFWTALFSLHILVVMAYFYAERKRREHGFINVHWILALSFSALFFVFGAGMCLGSLQFAFENTTTIENITKRSHVWYLAVYVPETVLQRYRASGRTDLRLIIYPRPPEEQLPALPQSGAGVSSNSEEIETPAITTPLPAVRVHSLTTNAPLSPLPPPSEPNHDVPPLTRTFAILETKPGASPFHLGYFNNFREVMGYHALYWFFPLRQSPCTNHDDPHCMYKTGRVLEKLRRNAGIVDGEGTRRHSSHRKKRGRRRRSGSGRSDGHRTGNDEDDS